MASVQTRGLTGDLLIEVSNIIALLGDAVGNVFYVNTSGSDSNNGLTWSTAFRTLIYAISQTVSGNGDVIYVAPGNYDETANGALGIAVALDNLSIRGVGEGVDITNSTTQNNGIVFNVTADNVVFSNIGIEKGEDTSTGAILINFDGCDEPFVINCHLHIDAADTTGIKLTGGTRYAFIGGLGNAESRIHGHIQDTKVGIGIDFDNCFQCTTQLFHMENLVTGAVFRADGDNNLLLPQTVIVRCTTGVSLESGAMDNAVIAVVADCATEFSDLSGNATNDRTESITSVRQNLEHIPKFTGDIWFVSNAHGLDTNSGRSPIEAFATIGNALNNAAEGDAITIESGDYYETGLDLNLIGLELWGEIGVTIYNTTGTGLTVSARSCRVNEIVIISPAQTALLVSGNYNVLTNITTPTPAIGASITGQGNRLRDFVIGAPTTTGLDISAPFNDIRDIIVSNNMVATRGYYLSSSDAILNTLQRCHSIGNTTAGFEVFLGADHNSFIKCTSGGGDGKRIDNGYHNFWDIIEQLTTEHNEQMHPISDGEGAAGDAVTVDNTATDDTPDTRSDQNYWGDTVAIILPDVLTTFWESIGIYILATTTNKTCQWQIWFPNAKFTSTRNAGNAWDLGETVITVADASLFLDDDLIWMRSDSHPDGEILIITNIAGNVITVASETRFSGNTGVRYDHVGNEAIYLIGRDTDDQFTSTEGVYGAGSSRDTFRYVWHKPKELPGDSAMIIRMLNTGDALDASFDVAAIYEM